MATYYCPRGCGKKLRKGDKTAEYWHYLNCKKQVFNRGPFKPSK